MKFSARHFVIFFVLLSTLLLEVACSRHKPISYQLASFPEQGICRVAVLPFTNRTEFRDGDVLLYRIFTAELSRLQNFELVQEGDVRSALRKVKVNPSSDRIDYDKMRIIADNLKAQVLMLGHISEMGEETIKGRPNPYLTVSLQLIRGDSGKTILTTHHRRNGQDYITVMHFGLISNTTQLSHVVSQEIIEDLAQEGFVASCTE